MLLAFIKENAPEAMEDDDDVGTPVSKLIIYEQTDREKGVSL